MTIGGLPGEPLALPTERIKAHRDGATGHIVFNNPERHNAVSLQMWDAVETALLSYAKDESVRVVVLSGAGGKSFVSGADITKFRDERGTKEATAHYGTRLKAVFGIYENYPKPTIAMINGYCIGGGLNLAACSDLRYCSEKSKFSMPAARLALGYPYDSIRRLLNAVGPGVAKQMMFTARSIDARTAWRLGLVQEVLPESQLEAHVREVAEAIAENAPLTIRAMKFISAQVLEPDPAKRDLARCDELVAACYRSEDYVEGWTAFLEKRKPVFKGR